MSLAVGDRQALGFLQLDSGFWNPFEVASAAFLTFAARALDQWRSPSSLRSKSETTSRRQPVAVGHASERAMGGVPSVQKRGSDPFAAALFADPFAHCSPFWQCRGQLRPLALLLAGAVVASAWFRRSMGRAKPNFHPRPIWLARGDVRAAAAWGKRATLGPSELPSSRQPVSPAAPAGASPAVDCPAAMAGAWLHPLLRVAYIGATVGQLCRPLRGSAGWSVCSASASYGDGLKYRFRWRLAKLLNAWRAPSGCWRRSPCCQSAQGG